MRSVLVVSGPNVGEVWEISLRPSSTLELIQPFKSTLGQLGRIIPPQDYEQETALYVIHEVKQWLVAVPTGEFEDPSLLAFEFAMAKAFTLGREQTRTRTEW